MPTTAKGRLDEAQKLLDDFLECTGLAGIFGNPNRRYLWTDAFALQACFALAKALEEPAYHDTAPQLIRLVHKKLGRFHPDDEREGWISGLPEEEAQKHPTADGLRALQGGKLFITKASLELGPLEGYLPLATKIEAFWLEKENQRASTWTGHLDINAVTLSASLLAKLEPLVFG